MMIIELAAAPWRENSRLRRRPPTLQIASLTDPRLIPLIIDSAWPDQVLRQETEIASCLVLQMSGAPG
jgi:hypothetical protein